jgi:hypothetical protein
MNISFKINKIEIFVYMHIYNITFAINLNIKYDIYETDHMFKQQWWGGYTRHNKIWKKVTSLVDNNTTEELVTENNAIMMYNPLLDK